MVMIAPSILSANFLNLREEIKKIELSGADWIHVDVMDGSFVPNITIGPFVIEQIKKATHLPIDVHLMIDTPSRYIKDFANAGADWITFHIEADYHSHRTLTKIKELGKHAGISITPQTSLNFIEYIGNEIDLLLIMSVNPGFGGQRFINSMLQKIARAKQLRIEMGFKYLISVDGGIKKDNADLVIDNGADILVMGSGFFSVKETHKLVETIKNGSVKN